MNIFKKSVKKIKFLIIYLSILLRTWNVSYEHCRGSQNTHFIFKNFFLKRCHLRYNGKIFGQATDDSMAHAHCMLDT